MAATVEVTAGRFSGEAGEAGAPDPDAAVSKILSAIVVGSIPLLAAVGFLLSKNKEK
jgi:hypothetical protein